MTSATLQRPATTRPRARGWIHWYSAIIGGVLGLVLVVMAAATVGTAAAVACGIYAVTIVGLFGISATYHRHTWVSVRARTWMKRADHSMIFVFIAGTYTPLAVLAIPGTEGVVMLLIVWIGAAGGVALKMLAPHSPRWVGVPFYIALGWVADLRHAGPAAQRRRCGGGAGHRRRPALHDRWNLLRHPPAQLLARARSATTRSSTPP